MDQALNQRPWTDGYVSSPYNNVMSNRNMGSTNQTKRPYGRVLLSVSVLIVCVGLSLEMSRHALAEQMYQKVVEKVEKEIVWKKDSPKAVRERFTGDDGKEMEVKVYMMNITNVADVRLGDRPILVRLLSKFFNMMYENL